MSIVLARLTAPLQHTGSLYLATYAQAVFGMVLAIAFGRITTISSQIDVVTRRHEPDTTSSTLALLTARVEIRRRLKRLRGRRRSSPRR